MLRRLLLVGLLLTPGAAFAQQATLQGLINTSPPSGFSQQPLRYNCTSTTYCWPLQQIYDGTTVVSVNAGDSGLTVHIGGGSIANTAFTANAGTNLNTSLLATDAHLTALGTGALATDAHLTTFTSANHTDLSSIITNTSGTSPTAYGGSGAATDLTELEAIRQNTSGAVPAGTNLIGKFGIDQTTVGTTNGVTPVAGAAGQGASRTGNIAANNTTAVVVKASAGTLYGAQLYGIGSAPAYLKLYDATSATCGSGTPVKRLIIPAASTAANGAGNNPNFGPVGVAFTTGITYCVTTGITDADTTAPAASTFLVNLDWK